MVHDEPGSTDVSRYVRKSEGAELLEPPGEAFEHVRREKPQLWAWRLTPPAGRHWAILAIWAGWWRWWRSMRQFSRPGFLRRVLVDHGARVRPAVHTAAGSFFLRGRP